MTTTTREHLVSIAQRIVRDGHPYTIAWYDDGDCESGPRGGTISGYRLGALSVELAANGSVTLRARRRRDAWTPWISTTVYDSSTMGKIDGSWSDPTAKAIKHQLQANGLRISPSYVIGGN